MHCTANSMHTKQFIKMLKLIKHTFGSKVACFSLKANTKPKICNFNVRIIFRKRNRDNLGIQENRVIGVLIICTFSFV